MNVKRLDKKLPNMSLHVGAMSQSSVLFPAGGFPVASCQQSDKTFFFIISLHKSNLLVVSLPVAGSHPHPASKDQLMSSDSPTTPVHTRVTEIQCQTESGAVTRSAD